MSSSPSGLETLRKILLQEANEGFPDRAVFGGLDRFLELHAGELGSLIGDLGPYSNLTPERREEWATSVLGAAPVKGEPDAPAAARSPSRRLPQAASRTPRRSPPSDISLDDSVTKLRGVGGGVSSKQKPGKENVASKLGRLGVLTVRDLLYHLPHRHNDFADIRKVSELEFGQEQTVAVKVIEASVVRRGGKQGSTQAVLGDDTGTVRAVWFNNPWMARTLRRGDRVVISGKANVFQGQFVFESPEYELLRGQEELLHTGRLVPVYPSVEGLYQRTLRGLAKQALDLGIPKVVEFLPEELRHRTGLMGRGDAVLQAHYPDSPPDWNAARRRLAFDELFLLQLTVLARKRAWQEGGSGIPLRADPGPLNAFLNSLPFGLTGAQSRVLREILDDLASDIPMNRLLQGDVGSGKTVIAAVVLLVAAFNGYQGALMAPTEILAEQHFLSISKLFSSITDKRADYLVSLWVDHATKGMTIGLLVGSLPKRAKDEIQRRLADEEIDVIIGTHALIQEAVEIPKLAVAVVDEQHRFGVMQRSALREKGRRPHILAMSATPIPRSLALTLYGDLDVSVIDEMPPGRQQIRTRWVEPHRRDAAYAFIRKEVQAGRQAFIVCPLIDESEMIRARAATEEHRRLSTEVFPDLRLGLLHGRMALREKEVVMDQFQRGELDVLVATTVIEVGIDIPNATVMLIEGADRFGLAQLHQLRGRVGRGAHQSHCLLLADAPGAEARERIKIAERIDDGFQLAEEDLRIRGPGDYMGTRQTGLPELKVARITDLDLLALARREATRILDADPDLSLEAHARLAAELKRFSAGIADEMS